MPVYYNAQNKVLNCKAVCGFARWLALEELPHQKACNRLSLWYGHYVLQKLRREISAFYMKQTERV